MPLMTQTFGQLPYTYDLYVFIQLRCMFSIYTSIDLSRKWLLFFCCANFLTYTESNDTITAEEQVAVISSLKAYFRSTCIFLLQLDQDYPVQVKHFKLLSAHNERVVSVSHVSQIHCHSNRPLVVMTATQTTAQGQLQQFSSMKNVSHWIWVLFLNTSPEIEELFSGTFIPFDCEFLVAQHKPGEVHLIEVYRVSELRSLSQQHFGIWTESGGLTTPEESFYTRRNNLEGITLRAGVLDDAYCDVVEEKNGRPLKLRGFSIEVWKVIENKLNFSTAFFMPKDGQYGMAVDSHTWNGLIGMLLRNETDVSITPLIWNKQRGRVVDFIGSIFKIDLLLAVRADDSSELVWNVFLKPFSPALWMSIAMTIVTSALVMLFLNKVWNESPDGLFTSFSESMLATFGAFCFQGQRTTPFWISGRIMFLSTYLTSVVILSSYSASLISHITIQGFKLPFNDLEGFLKDGTYKLGVLRSSGDLSYFKESSDSMIGKVYQKLIAPYEPSSLFETYIEGLERVCSQHKYASVFGNDKFTSLNSIKCMLHFLQIVEYDMSMTIQKDSPYKGALTFAVQQMLQSGLVQVLLKLYAPVQDISKGNTFTNVSLRQMTPIFVVLVAGVLLGVLFMATEQLINLFLQRNSNTPQPPTKLMLFTNAVSEDWNYSEINK